MADRKISDLTALTTPASGDFLPIVDISEAAAASKNKKITYSDFLNNIPTGTITSTMILDGTILNADINASAAIVDTKLATIATGGKVSNSATTATDANTASAIVARDGSGNFTAGTITANLTGTASNVTTNANLTGDVTSVGNATSIAAGVIVNADINASAAIVDTKLATIATAGKVSNSATTATDANTASAIVARDGSGNFTAGTITAALTGAASSNVLKAGDTMTGALVVPLASAATPSLTFTGDLDSGLFSPGANQVAVATNGTGRLFVDASGRVGIEVTPSTTFLHVYTDAPSTVSAPTICLEGGFNGYGAGIDFASRTSSGGTLVSMAKITADGEAAWNTTASTQDANLRFFTAAAGLLSERLRITSAGLVGIGTSSPATVLDVASSNSGITLTNTGASNKQWRLGGSIAGSFVITEAGVDDRLTIDSSGRVGIGTVSPAARLHVVGSGGAIRMQDTTATSKYIQMRGDSTNSHLEHIGGPGDALRINNQAAGTIEFFTSGIEKARIDSSGRLLVGASADSGGALLQVNGDRIRVATAKTPASAADTGTAGEICWDASYIYVCTATNTWKRSAIATW
jgi:hypothetical protein